MVELYCVNYTIYIVYEMMLIGGNLFIILTKYIKICMIINWKNMYQWKKKFYHKTYKKIKLMANIYTLQTVLYLYWATSTHVWLPPEFKHINKGRKRNQMGFPE